MKTLYEIYNELVVDGVISEAYKKVSDYRTDNRTSKMWVSPKGEVFNLTGGMWHHNFIEQNAKKYKIKIKHKGEDMRLDGINAGWFRVNYETNSGDLTIEGKRKYYIGKIKDALFGVIKRNLNSISTVFLTLFDDNLNIDSHGKANLFPYDGEEKLEHIPFITESIKRLHDKKYLKEQTEKEKGL